LTEPPKHLRRRVSVSVEREPKRSWAGIFVPWAITAALSIALVSIGVSGRRQSGETPKLQQAISILNDPATGDVTFGETEKPPSPAASLQTPKGRIFVNPGKGVVFIGANLPRIDSGKTLELWVTATGGNPSPGGLFRSQPDGTAVFVRPGPVENAAAIAVTVEPEGGSAQPTTKPIVTTKILPASH
jgi:hypothetical protein